MARERLCAVSVDLDEIPCYAAIHGLDVPASSAHALYEHAVPRLAELFAEEGVRATFFAVSGDLAGRPWSRAENAATLRRLHADGHEIASHSDSHAYDLTRRGRAFLEDDLATSVEVLEREVGVRPRGFRAPGYTITDATFDVLETLDFAYDASVFPCPAYFGAKAAAIGLYGAKAALGRGRASRSIVDDPRVLSAPADPYRPGRPYWSRGDRALVELPIGVTRGARLPFIGTSVALAGERGAALLAMQMVGRPHVSLELHAIDLADADSDGLAWLAPHQPDLRRSADAKRRALASALRVLRDAGYRFVPCLDAARAFAGS